MAVPLPVGGLWPYIRRVIAPDPLLVFDRATLRQRRERAAGHWDQRAFLKREIASRLVERLDDIRRAFPLALDLAMRDGRIKAGDLVVLEAMGGGFTWGACVLRL